MEFKSDERHAKINMNEQKQEKKIHVVGKKLTHNNDVNIKNAKNRCPNAPRYPLLEAAMQRPSYVSSSKPSTPIIYEFNMLLKG